MLGMVCFAPAGVERVAMPKATSKPTRSKHKASTDGSVGCRFLWALQCGNGSAGHMDRETVLMPETNAPIRSVTTGVKGAAKRSAWLNPRSKLPAVLSSPPTLRLQFTCRRQMA
uniref:cDNA sequence BC043934 n=1 Tax=Mus musculus TaxID=10090 RepID=Q8BQG2_MOUSE|nr:CDNA sequence BC043934 [Mus musculus]AAH43934.1 CDNA sequence BC043934 [Mus musculus]BAC34423.1 unnamed protein product [Mus musculus]